MSTRMYSLNISMIILWKVVSVIFNPNIITTTMNTPHSVTNVIFSWFAKCIRIWLYPLNPSKKLYTSWPATTSNTPSINGSGNSSVTVKTLSFRSIETWIFSFFFSTMTIRLSHVSCFNGQINPTLSRLSVSSLNFVHNLGSSVMSLGYWPRVLAKLDLMLVQLGIWPSHIFIWPSKHIAKFFEYFNHCQFLLQRHFTRHVH